MLKLLRRRSGAIRHLLPGTLSRNGLEDAILLLRDPRLGKRGMILASKLAARELGPVFYVDRDEIWNTEKMMTDEEWIAFGPFLRSMVRRKR
jgi:hypothetical protein